jgi:predicted ABC-type ATPase
LTSSRPVILVLAGVNGAGKSSVAGALLHERGQTWFNPDSYSRKLMLEGFSKEEADSAAWLHGKRQLEAALANGTDYAFETTLGGSTIARLLTRLAETHDVFMIFVGLSSPEMHIHRVKIRVEAGGHDIPEEKIRQRWDGSRRNLIAILPHLAMLQVFDNSDEGRVGQPAPPPTLLLEMRQCRILYPPPNDLVALERTPAWARSIVETALRQAETP